MPLSVASSYRSYHLNRGQLLERSGLSTEIFGTLANGETVEAVTLTNANGMSVKVIGYGASIQPVCVPDAQGRFADVTTGLQRWMNMLPSRSFMGPPLAVLPTGLRMRASL